MPQNKVARRWTEERHNNIRYYRYIHIYTYVYNAKGNLNEDKKK